MEPIIIKLISPITFGSDNITELKIRPAKAKDLRDLPIEPKLGDIMNVAAKLSGHPPSVIDELSSDDLSEVLAAVGKYMGVGQKTGEKS